MSKILNNLTRGSLNLDDKMILDSAIATAKGNASMYLTATLGATTPELRTFYSAGLTQAIEAHAALTELALNKQWINPYDDPENQLNYTLNDSKNAIQ